MSEATGPDDAAAGGRGVVDDVTGLPNRIGWDAVLETEECRCRRYGGNPGVIAVELKGRRVPPAQLRLVAETLVRATRDTDTVARVGSRHFAVLAPGGGASIATLAARLHGALEAAGLSASLQARSRRAWGGLPQAWRQAEATAVGRRWITPGILLVTSETPSRN